jgi:Yippee zinc-binding/DNA-binding /Mis18, centromere assembly
MVDVAGERLVSQDGWDVNCVFNMLNCRGCREVIGRRYVSVTPVNPDLLNTYTFAASALISYQLGVLESTWPSGHERDGPGIGSQLSGDVRRNRGVHTGGSDDDAVFGRGTSVPVRQHSRANAKSGSGGATSGDKRRQHDDGDTGGDVSGAISELDRHVAALTEATNKLTVAQRESSDKTAVLDGKLNGMEVEVTDLGVELKGHLSELSTHIMHLDKEVVGCEKMMLLWEERFRKLERAVFPGIQHVPLALSELAPPSPSFAHFEQEGRHQGDPTFLRRRQPQEKQQEDQQQQEQAQQQLSPRHHRQLRTQPSNLPQAPTSSMPQTRLPDEAEPNSAADERRGRGRGRARGKVNGRSTNSRASAAVAKRVRSDN